MFVGRSYSNDTADILNCYGPLM